MELDIYVVDAFTDTQFKGNSAAVVPLQEWLEPELMQNIATENNLSETAFVKTIGTNQYEIRWFSPLTEIDFVDTQRSPLPWCCSINSALQEVLSFTH